MRIVACDYLYSKGGGGGGVVGICVPARVSLMVTLEYLIPSGRRLVDPFPRCRTAPLMPS